MARASYSSRAAWLEVASPVRVWPRSTPQGLHAIPEEPYCRASRQGWRRKHGDARRCHVPLGPISAAVSNLPQMSEGGRRVAPTAPCDTECPSWRQDIAHVLPLVMDDKQQCRELLLDTTTRYYG